MAYIPPLPERLRYFSSDCSQDGSMTLTLRDRKSNTRTSPAQAKSPRTPSRIDGNAAGLREQRSTNATATSLRSRRRFAPSEANSSALRRGHTISDLRAPHRPSPKVFSSSVKREHRFDAGTQTEKPPVAPITELSSSDTAAIIDFLIEKKIIPQATAIQMSPSRSSRRDGEPITPAAAPEKSPSPSSGETIRQATPTLKPPSARLSLQEPFWYQSHPRPPSDVNRAPTPIENAVPVHLLLSHHAALAMYHEQMANEHRDAVLYFQRLPEGMLHERPSWFKKSPIISSHYAPVLHDTKSVKRPQKDTKCFTHASDYLGVFADVPLNSGSGPGEVECLAPDLGFKKTGTARVVGSSTIWKATTVAPRGFLPLEFEHSLKSSIAKATSRNEDVSLNKRLARRHQNASQGSATLTVRLCPGPPPSPAQSESNEDSTACTSALSITPDRSSPPARRDRRVDSGVDVGGSSSDTSRGKGKVVRKFEKLEDSVSGDSHETSSVRPSTPHPEVISPDILHLSKDEEMDERQAIQQSLETEAVRKMTRDGCYKSNWNSVFDSSEVRDDSETMPEDFEAVQTGEPSGERYSGA